MRVLKDRTFIGIMCILLSLLICFGVTPIFNDRIAETVEIVRVKKEIIEGEQITKDMLNVETVGGYNLPNNVLTDINAIVGKYATANLTVGDYILSNKISTEPQRENEYLYNLDGKRQAISVTLKNLANGVSGKLVQGDIVSIIAPDFRESGITKIPAELKYVEVVGVTTPSGYDTNTNEEKLQDKNKDEKELPTTVTLLANPEQSKILAELEADGTIHLSLVYRGSKEECQKFLDAQNEVIDKLYFEPKKEDIKELETESENEVVE